MPSMTPTSRPPRAAPGMLPMPPSTTMTKTLSRNDVPTAGMHVEERHEHGRRDTHEGGAQGVGHAVDALVVDPHEPRHLAVLAGRAHRAPEIGAREEQVEPEAGDEHRAHPDQARHADDDPPDLEGGERHVGLDGLEVGREEEEGHVLEHEGQAQGDQEHAHRLARALAQRGAATRARAGSGSRGRRAAGMVMSGDRYGCRPPSSQSQ